MGNLTFNEAVFREVEKGTELFEAIKVLEKSGKFTEKEIQEWFDKFNSFREGK